MDDECPNCDALDAQIRDLRERLAVAEAVLADLNARLPSNTVARCHDGCPPHACVFEW